MKAFLALAMAVTTARAYWLMGVENFITTERIDPIVNPGRVSGHVHSVLGGSNFRFNTNTAALRQSECTSIPIPQDKSAYWFPHLYYQWKNGSFSSLNGGAVIYYLFSDKPGTTTAFPDDFRMLSGDPTLRTHDPNSAAQKAVTFLCLDFNGKSVTYNELPPVKCPSGVRAQINFQSCWDGKNLDSPDHKSHVAFPSGGPDSGTCSDPKFPITLPRIFLEVYWATGEWDKIRDQAKDPNQPFVYAMGDPTGYGYHADFINGWDAGVLQRAVDNCHCNIYGDPTCCVQQGIFGMKKDQHCRITKSIDEQTTGTLAKLPGNNPIQGGGKKAVMMVDSYTPGLISPVYAYTGDQPTKTGVVATPGQTQPATGAPSPSSIDGGSSTSAPSSAGTTPPVASSSAAPPPSSSTDNPHPTFSTSPTHILVPVPPTSTSDANSPTTSASATSHTTSTAMTSPTASATSVVASNPTTSAGATSFTTSVIATSPTTSAVGATSQAPSPTKPGHGRPTLSIPPLPHPSFPIPGFPVPAFPYPHFGGSSMPSAPKPTGPAANHPGSGNQSHPHHHHHHHGHGSGKTCSREKRDLNVDFERRSSGLKHHRRTRQQRAIVEA